MSLLRIVSVVSVVTFGVASVVACSGGVASDPIGSSGSSGASSSSSSSGASSSSSSSSGASSSTSSSSSGASSSGGGRVPAKHRATASACDNVRDVPEPTAGATGGCTKHADCTAGKNGRCVAQRAGYQCTYDACTQDSDCKSGVCECEGGSGASNVCLETTGCKVDADCGGGGYCSPTQGDCGGYSGTVAYECHQATDECVDDADCPSGAVGSCRFNKQLGHWRCETSQCAG